MGRGESNFLDTPGFPLGPGCNIPQTDVEDLFASLQLIKTWGFGMVADPSYNPRPISFWRAGDETQKPPTDVETVLAVDLHGPTRVRNFLVQSGSDTPC